MSKEQRGAFTLIELLIVVLIIAILAAIAVPNFLEFQTRAKVTRAMSDMRNLKTALEAYRVDNGAYIRDLFGVNMWGTWAQLTTPIAYMTTIPPSPFKFKNYMPQYNQYGQIPYDYGKTEDNPNLEAAEGRSIYYIIVCGGPDEDADFGWGQHLVGIDEGRPASIAMIYDPTNGTVSSGDVMATNKQFY